MNRILGLLREQLATPKGDTDRLLLDRFLAERDEAAFAELVRRHGSVVWGVCHRRLANHHDAEDAFQATFLVLLRRAARLGRDIPLGPWLHRVAVMTARNVQRGNRRRAAVSGPLEHEVPTPKAEPVAERLDLDAALLALPERYRVPVVLCHLQGLSRREAAALLGCPEGTLSSLLSRALVRLRARLGSAVAGLLAGAGATSLPNGLHAATVRSGMIFTTSTLTAAGVSPAVVGLTSGVLRMFWMKKVIAGLAMTVVVAGGLLAGFTLRTDGVAHATTPLAGDPQAAPEDPDAAVKRLEKQIADLRKQKELLGAMEMDLFAEKAKLEEAKKAKAAAAAVEELGKDVAVSVGEGKSPTYTVREVVNGKVAEIRCSDLDMLTTYLTRAFSDPKGPKKIRVSAYKDHPSDQLRQVFAACATAGFTKASFSHTPITPTTTYVTRTVMERVPVTVYRGVVDTVETPPKPGEIDLTKYAPKKP
jgi:RNA polymerase sigma factor (sigma-70 family)